MRLDSGVESGSVIPGTFDSMMAKLIVTGATREQALTRARRALAEFQIEGVASVLPFHRAVIAHPDFVGEQGFKVHTRWIESDFAEPLAAAVRAQPQVDTSLVRTAIEIDGRRVQLGLPAMLLQGLASGLVRQPPQHPSRRPWMPRPCSRRLQATSMPGRWPMAMRSRKAM